MRRLVTSLAIVCALLAFAPVAVGAASNNGPQAAIADCNDHQALTQHYSAATLRTALAIMPAAVREYSNCYDVIEKALLAEVGAGSSSGSATTGSSSGGSVLPTWLIIVIVILALAALTFGALAIRRRRLEGPGGPDASTQGGVPRARANRPTPALPIPPGPRGSRQPGRPVRVRPRRRGLTAHGSNSVYRTVIFTSGCRRSRRSAAGRRSDRSRRACTEPLLGKARWTSK